MQQINCFTFLLTFLLISCAQVAQKEVSATDEQVSQENESRISSRDNDYKDFTSVSLGTNADVFISKGPFSFKMEGPEDAMEKIEISVKSGDLRIKDKGHRSPKETVRVQISMPEISSLSIGGSGDIEVLDEFTGLDELDISIGGSGDIIMELEAKEIEVSIGGSGKVDLAGYCDELEISIAGSGDVNAYELETRNCEVSLAGGGEVYVFVTDDLEANIVGGGDVHVKGNPNISGTQMGGGDLIRED